VIGRRLDACEGAERAGSNPHGPQSGRQLARALIRAV